MAIWLVFLHNSWSLILSGQCTIHAQNADHNWKTIEWHTFILSQRKLEEDSSDGWDDDVDDVEELGHLPSRSRTSKVKDEHFEARGLSKVTEKWLCVCSMWSLSHATDEFGLLPFRLSHDMREIIYHTVFDQLIVGVHHHRLPVVWRKSLKIFGRMLCTGHSPVVQLQLH